jgi:hypothetical protein
MAAGKNAIFKIVKIPNLAQKRSFPPLCIVYQNPKKTQQWANLIIYKPCLHFFLLFAYRLTPYEWENPTPWKESDEVENTCTLHNCFWHNWGSLMQQGSDICPRY